MGSGGGCINSNAQAKAGDGGGIVILLTTVLENQGWIEAKGTPGTYTHHQASGGGSGGSIFLYVAQPENSAGLDRTDVAGGAGGVDPNECSVRPTGGTGSEGRVVVTQERR